MKYIIDIKGEIEGDYEIIGKYKPGKWIVHYECPKCGEITKDFMEYCPFCGADMRGNQND